MSVGCERILTDCMHVWVGQNKLMGHAQVSQSFDGAGKLGNRFPARERERGTLAE